MDQTDQESGGNNHNNKSGSNGGGGYTCRQTSTRWTPTTEQIRILKDLYYNNGVRSPTADQIQKISARLRQYGKIEGKNVFYWFQNHKARERQKKRFNGNNINNMNTTTLPSNSSMITTTAAVAAANDHYHNHHHNHLLLHNHHPIQRNVKLDQDHHNRFPTFHNGSENGAINASNGYMSSHVYGSMEQDCSMSYNNMNINGGWVNMDHHNHYSSAPYNFFDRPKPLFDSEGQQDDDEDVDQTLIYGSDAYLEHRRTLPLFPMHDEDPINGAAKKYGQSDGYDRFRNSYASLELRLSSYAGVAPD